MPWRNVKPSSSLFDLEDGVL